MHVLILTLCLMAARTCFAMQSDQCCRGGYEMGLQIVRGGSGHTECKPDPGLFKGKSVFEKSLCADIFKSYCSLTCANQFCIVGVQMGMANQVCAKVDLVGGDQRKVCCDCCKSGKEHAMSGESCDMAVEGDDNECKISFQECCKATKDMAPTEAPIETDTDTASAVPVQPKACPTGHELVDGKCQDIDECKVGTQNCPPASFCNNNAGAYTCYSNCPSPTYQVLRQRTNDVAGICADVDECAMGKSNCQKNYQCVNSVGGYTCKRVSCDVGYRFINGYCEDLDECQDAGICGPKGSCRNAYGTYYCDCHTGYMVDQNTKKCVDKNECEISNTCQYKCRNTEGSYECYCPHGYTLTGRYCSDVNECETNPCTSPDACFNTYGGHSCINEPCPNEKYYTKTRSNVCMKKFCKFNDFRCKLLKESSIKWQAFKLFRNLPPKFFQFIYSLSGFGTDINYHFAIVSGNDDHSFDIERKGKGKVAIFNAKKLTVSRDFRIKMYADIRKGTELLTRYTYIFYIFVSPYQF